MKITKTKNTKTLEHNGISISYTKGASDNFYSEYGLHLEILLKNILLLEQDYNYRYRNIQPGIKWGSTYDITEILFDTESLYRTRPERLLVLDILKNGFAEIYHNEMESDADDPLTTFIKVTCPTETTRAITIYKEIRGGNNDINYDELTDAEIEVAFSDWVETQIANGLTNFGVSIGENATAVGVKRQILKAEQQIKNGDFELIDDISFDSEELPPEIVSQIASVTLQEGQSNE